MPYRNTLCGQQGHRRFGVLSDEASSLLEAHRALNHYSVAKTCVLYARQKRYPWHLLVYDYDR